MLKIIDYTKIYSNNKKAVNNLNLQIDSGDIYGFIGHNGAGKTTTLKAVAGILPVEHGDILINGKSIKSEPVLCKSISAYIPDNPDIYDFLTGIQYLNFIGDIFNISAADRKNRIEEYSTLFEIKNNLGDLISSFSHGMKQKLVIIAALLHKPLLLILDEPFVGLDPKASLNLKKIMKDLCDSGSAIFFSTHVLDVAEKLCNKIGIIKNGHLVASGNTEEILKQGSLEDLYMEVLDNEK